MKTLYFLSGFDKIKGFTEEIANNLKKDIIDRNALVSIASSPDDYEKTDKYFSILIEWFKNIGIIFKHYSLVDNRKKDSQIINEASCIFLSGGTTIKQMEFLRENNFCELLKDYNGIIMGMSAGAINMGKNSLSLKSKKNLETVIYKGLELADITIIPHFSIFDEDKINKLLKYQNEYKIYGMCDNSAIIKQGDKIKIIGEMYRIYKNKISRIDKI
jgi:peptidase E